VISALMRPAVPFYIILNTTTERFLVPLAVYTNWNANRLRKSLILIGVAAYFAMRIWTYSVFAENRLEMSLRPLTAADVEWFKATLAIDFRLVLNVIMYICWIWAAFAGAAPHNDHAQGDV
jgi:hypothetical protein